MGIPSLQASLYLSDSLSFDEAEALGFEFDPYSAANIIEGVIPKTQ
ncbi:hypothetical protein JXA34_01585 [Patescibacteria group bacterium]|nr:hypothetical protein [Patescibacteria group bacterium]